MNSTLDDIWTTGDGITMFTDRDGRPMTLRAWSEKQADATYKTLARTSIGDKTVITVWLGIDQNFGGDGTNPLTFGTIIQHLDGTFDAESEQFTVSEQEALRTHRTLVSLLAAQQH